MKFHKLKDIPFIKSHWVNFFNDLKEYYYVAKPEVRDDIGYVHLSSKMSFKEKGKYIKINYMVNDEIVMCIEPYLDLAYVIKLYKSISDENYTINLPSCTYNKNQICRLVYKMMCESYLNLKPNAI